MLWRTLRLLFTRIWYSQFGIDGCRSLYDLGVPGLLVARTGGNTYLKTSQEEIFHKNDNEN